MPVTSKTKNKYIAKTSKLKNPYKIASRVNLTIDEDFCYILGEMKAVYPLLKEVDLIKMAVSGYYSQNIDDFVEELDEETSRNVEISRQEFRDGKYKTFSSVDELMKDLNS